MSVEKEMKPYRNMEEIELLNLLYIMAPNIDTNAEVNEPWDKEVLIQTIEFFDPKQILSKKEIKMSDLGELNQQELRAVLKAADPSVQIHGKWGAKKLIELIRAASLVNDEANEDDIVISTGTEEQDDLFSDVVDTAEPNDDELEEYEVEESIPEPAVDVSERIASFKECVASNAKPNANVTLTPNEDNTSIEIKGPGNKNICININHDNDKAILAAIRSFVSRI